MNQVIAFLTPDGSTSLQLPVSLENPLPVYAVGGGPGGGVTSITGTAGQIVADQATGAVTLSLPAAITGVTSIIPAAGTLTLGTGAGNANVILAPHSDGSVVSQFATAKVTMNESVFGGGYVGLWVLPTATVPTNANFALLRNASGEIYLNSAAGTDVNMRVGNTDRFTVSNALVKTRGIDFESEGDVKAVTYHVGADAGVDGTITAASTVTVKKGIITNIA